MYEDQKSKFTLDYTGSVTRTLGFIRTGGDRGWGRGGWGASAPNTVSEMGKCLINGDLINRLLLPQGAPECLFSF